VGTPGAGGVSLHGEAPGRQEGSATWCALGQSAVATPLAGGVDKGGLRQEPTAEGGTARPFGRGEINGGPPTAGEARLICAWTIELINLCAPRVHVSALQPTLQNVALQVQAELNSILATPMGAMIRSYLPQVWVFETEQEVLTLAVDVMGRVSTFPGGMQERDVTIRMREAPLQLALQTRDARRTLPADAPRVEYHSPKGNTAFTYLRGRFGL
jgi:hypothetical protein